MSRVAALVWAAACACGTGGSTRPPPQIVQLNAPGAVVDVHAALPPGYVAIVDFWSASCGACAIVGAKVSAAIADEPRILLRKVDVGDGFTPVAAAYQIGAMPHFDVYDRLGRLRYVLVGNDCLQAPAIARALLSSP
jgi:hypothetical protein